MQLSTPGGTAGTVGREVVRARLESTKFDYAGLLVRIALFGALAFTVLLLVVLLVTIARDGLDVLTSRPSSFIQGTLRSLPSEAGIHQGLRGTFWIGVFVVFLGFPLGIGAAIYIEEYAPDTRLTRFISANIRNLAGVPSIVYGLLGLAIFVQLMADFTGGRSLLSGGLTMSILVLPIVIITTAEALRAVPLSIREAAFGVGATRWEVVRSHVLPYAAPGILTGTILAFSRALGEAAPLILVGGAPGFFAAAGGGVVDTLHGPYTALPAVIFNWSRRSLREFGPLTAAAIVVLLGVLLVINGLAIYLRNRYERQW